MSLDKPLESATWDQLTYSWDCGISLELSGLSDAGKAEVRALRRNGAERPLLIDVVDLNLKAGRSREEYCKRLSGLAPVEGFDWKLALAYVVPMALDAVRRGNPVIQLGAQGREFKRPEWDAHPFVLRGAPSIIFGDRGSLKSKWALYLALLMQWPWPDNPMGVRVGDKPLSVLKLDFEFTPDADEYDWQRLLRGIDRPNAITLNYRLCERPLASDVRGISVAADAVQADVLIIDSLGPACGGDLNASEPALELYGALRQLKRSVLITAHSAKNATGRRTVFGSGFFENLARNVWECVREDPPAGPNVERTVFKQTKAPPFSARMKPIGVEWHFDDKAESTTVQMCDPESVEGFEGAMSIGAEIRQLLLHEGALAPLTIAKALSRSPDAVRMALMRGKKKHTLTMLPDGKYAVEGSDE